MGSGCIRDCNQFRLEQIDYGLRRNADQETTAAAIEIDIREVEHGLLQIDGHFAARRASTAGVDGSRGPLIAD